MWDNSGDCTVFFAEETSFENPIPHLRVHVSVLEAANSAFITNLVRYGELPTEEALEDEISTVYENPSSRFSFSRPELLFQDTAPNTTTTRRAVPADFGMGSPFRDRQGQSNAFNAYLRTQQQVSSRPRAISDLGSETVVSFPRVDDTAKDILTHEIWFRAPSHIGSPQIQRRHHIATRNFLALLYGQTLVGVDLYEMLTDLQNVMDTYYELNEPNTRRNSTEDIINYLSERKLDDVRNDLKAALNLLAWCELPNVRWEQGYIEAFVHCVGMMKSSTMETIDFKNLTRVSRHNLENAFNSLQLRILDAEERLRAFSFTDLWDLDGGAPGNSPYKRSFDAFRDFLHGFYYREYRSWPPRANADGRWLTRILAQRLQDDFGCMYDFLVDRDVVWDGSEARATRKWEIVSTAGGLDFRADRPGLPLTDMLVAFDSKNKYQHIPHPFPLLPQPLSSAKAAPQVKKSLFGGLKKAKAVAQRDQKEHFQMSLAFNGATNINRFGISIEGELTRFVISFNTG